MTTITIINIVLFTLSGLAFANEGEPFLAFLLFFIALIFVADWLASNRQKRVR